MPGVGTATTAKAVSLLAVAARVYGKRLSRSVASKALMLGAEDPAPAMATGFVLALVGSGVLGVMMGQKRAVVTSWLVAAGDLLLVVGLAPLATNVSWHSIASRPEVSSTVLIDLSLLVMATSLALGAFALRKRARGAPMVSSQEVPV